MKRQRETGDFQALPNQPPGNGHKITDWEKFAFFVEVNGDKTQKEMAQMWPEAISERTISRALDISKNSQSLPQAGFESSKSLPLCLLTITV